MLRYSSYLNKSSSIISRIGILPTSSQFLPSLVTIRSMSRMNRPKLTATKPLRIPYRAMPQKGDRKLLSEGSSPSNSSSFSPKDSHSSQQSKFDSNSDKYRSSSSFASRNSDFKRSSYSNEKFEKNSRPFRQFDSNKPSTSFNKNYSSPKPMITGSKDSYLAKRDVHINVLSRNNALARKNKFIPTGKPRTVKERELLVNVMKKFEKNLVSKDSLLHTIDRRLVSNEILKPSVVNSMIKSFGKMNLLDRVDDLFSLIRSQSKSNLKQVKIDEEMINTALSAHAQNCRNGDLSRALKIFEDMRSLDKLTPNRMIYTTLISACSKFGNHKQVQHLLSQMQLDGVQPDTYLYNSVLTAYERAHDYQAALTLFNFMEENVIRKDHITYGVAMSCCGKIGDWETAMELLSEFEEEHKRSGRKITNAMLSSMILSFANSKNWTLGLELFEHHRFETTNHHLSGPRVNPFSSLFGVAENVDVGVLAAALTCCQVPLEAMRAEGFVKLPDSFSDPRAPFLPYKKYNIQEKFKEQLQKPQQQPQNQLPSSSENPTTVNNSLPSPLPTTPTPSLTHSPLNNKLSTTTTTTTTPTTTTSKKVVVDPTGVMQQLHVKKVEAHAYKHWVKSRSPDKEPEFTFDSTSIFANLDLPSTLSSTSSSSLEINSPSQQNYTNHTDHNTTTTTTNNNNNHTTPVEENLQELGEKAQYEILTFMSAHPDYFQPFKPHYPTTTTTRNNEGKEEENSMIFSSIPLSSSSSSSSSFQTPPSFNMGYRPSHPYHSVMNSLKQLIYPPPTTTTTKSSSTSSSSSFDSSSDSSSSFSSIPTPSLVQFPNAPTPTTTLYSAVSSVSFPPQNSSLSSSSTLSSSGSSSSSSSLSTITPFLDYTLFLIRMMDEMVVEQSMIEMRKTSQSMLKEINKLKEETLKLEERLQYQKKLKSQDDPKKRMSELILIEKNIQRDVQTYLLSVPSSSSQPTTTTTPSLSAASTGSIEYSPSPLPLQLSTYLPFELYPKSALEKPTGEVDFILPSSSSSTFNPFSSNIHPNLNSNSKRSLPFSSLSTSSFSSDLYHRPGTYSLVLKTLAASGRYAEGLVWFERAIQRGVFGKGNAPSTSPHSSSSTTPLPLPLSEVAVGRGLKKTPLFPDGVGEWAGGERVSASSPSPPTSSSSPSSSALTPTLKKGKTRLFYVLEHHPSPSLLSSSSTSTSSFPFSSAVSGVAAQSFVGGNKTLRVDLSLVPKHPGILSLAIMHALYTFRCLRTHTLPPPPPPSSSSSPSSASSASSFASSSSLNVKGINNNDNHNDVEEEVEEEEDEDDLFDEETINNTNTYNTNNTNNTKRLNRSSKPLHLRRSKPERLLFLTRGDDTLAQMTLDVLQNGWIWTTEEERKSTKTNINHPSSSSSLTSSSSQKISSPSADMSVNDDEIESEEQPPLTQMGSHSSPQERVRQAFSQEVLKGIQIFTQKHSNSNSPTSSSTSSDQQSQQQRKKPRVSGISLSREVIDGSYLPVIQQVYRKMKGKDFQED